jgi:carbamoyltransferase
MLILGISAFYHDSAASLLKDGEVICAAQEERFTRIKHDSSFPVNAINFCLEYANCSIDDIEYIAYYEKPSLKFDRLVKTYLMTAPSGYESFIRSMPVWLKEKLWLKRHIRKKLKFKGKIISPEHHQSHAASAYYPSPFDKAAFITMDGVGEWATLSYGYAENNQLDIKQEIKFPHSLGLLYSAFTYYCGFKVNSGEYKLMGLAPYGKPKYTSLILDKLIDLKDDGSFKLDMSYFNFHVGFTMTNGKFHDLFNREPRKSESEITELDMDLAASIQLVTEEIVLKIAAYVKEQTQVENLCLSGGVALNCVSNGRLYREGIFKNIWIQPASGDAGSALGAALYVWYKYLGNKRLTINTLDRQSNSYLGTYYNDKDIEAFLNDGNLPYLKLNPSDLIDTVSNKIAGENVVGWFDGRMEFGPRALGSRSILGDARSKDMQSTMNLKIKYRESFRPFAPIIRAEDVREWFEVDGNNDPLNNFSSPYMLMVAPIKESRRLAVDNSDNYNLENVNQSRSEVPAVTHVDFSARLQTVHQESNQKLHDLLSVFKEKTGCPIMINTSFNVRGEPIVESIEDAYRCFMRTEMDYLVLGDFILDKKQQPEYNETQDWKNIFELD